MSDKFKLIKYYRKLINKKCFVDFLSFVRDRISDADIDQEYLRFALTGNQIIVELGNRVALKFEEKDGAVCQIGLLVDEKFIELNPDYEEIYRFTGSNPMAYCEQSVIEFSELNIDFKQNHREVIKEYLKVVENSRLSDIRKGSSTDLDSLKELIFSNKDLRDWFNQSKLDIHEIVKYIILESNFQEVVSSQDFFFSELQEFYEAFKAFDVSNIKSELEEILSSKSRFNFQDLLDNSEGGLNEFILLIGKMISVIDSNAYNKHNWNPYEDSRILAKSGVNQKDWTNQLIKFKLDSCQFQNNNGYVPGFRYLMEFTMHPDNNFSIASKTHRNLIQQYFKLASLEELIDYYKDDLPALNNEANKTYLITRLLYHFEIKSLWEAPYQGLLTLDNTAWFDDFIKKQGKSNFGVVWHSKRPSGTTHTFNSLKKLYKKQSSFPIFYAMKGEVCYKAEVLDFASSQKELDSKSWDKKYGSIYAFRPELENYVDGDKKAAVVFLVSNLEKIEPIPIKDFKFYNDTPPRQNNLQPVTAIPYFKSNNIIPTEKVEKTKDMNQNIPLNQILFGPPGTGKTYHTINKALQIIGDEEVENLNWKERSSVKELFNKKVKDGQIVFTTFHQSMSYEDFIEGIKPEKPYDDDEFLKYDIQEGIFKKIADEARFAIIKKYNSQSDSERLSFSNAFDQLADRLIELKEEGKPATLKSRNGSDFIFDGMSSQGNLLIKHFEGGDNYTVSKSRLSKLNNGIPDLGKVNNIHKEFRTVIGGSNASVYWAVLNAIEQIIDTSTNTTIGEEETITREDKTELINKQQLEFYRNKTAEPYVIIIDEINRGNVSQIFGELITLIEKDKRAGNKEALEITLPYSKENFSVPNNLYIIGTMNTADRSIEALDTALRRRFSFEEMPPKTDLLAPNRMYWELLWNYKDVGWEDQVLKKKEDGMISLFSISDKIINDRKIKWESFEKEGKQDSQIEEFKISEFKGVNLNVLLETINDRIEKLIDKDHKIGHSYFLNVTSEEELRDTFKDKVIPLLEEYFFGDFGKIGLVLGSSFISKTSKAEITFAKNHEYDTAVEADLLAREIYTLTPTNEWDFKAIYE